MSSTLVLFVEIAKSLFFATRGMSLRDGTPLYTVDSSSSQVHHPIFQGFQQLFYEASHV